MGNWKYTLNIENIWNNDESSAEKKGKQIAAKMQQKFPNSWIDFEHDDYDEEFENIIDALENITGYDSITPVEEFNDVMDQLYDWANQMIAPFKWYTSRLCWIKTS